MGMKRNLSHAKNSFLLPSAQISHNWSEIACQIDHEWLPKNDKFGHQDRDSVTIE